MKVLEEEGIIAYIKKRNLADPYLKAKSGYYKTVDLRKREPKKDGVLYFKNYQEIPGNWLY